MSPTFFTAAPSVQRFADAAEHDSYVAVPAGHHVVVTDVAGSTEAVRAGRYREVNYVGAASIAAALNATDGADLPFVFGGDGATFVVPDALMPRVEAALAALRVHARDALDLDLRAGAVPIATISAAGYRVGVARLEVSPNYTQALFLGGGLTYAERLVKDPETRAQFEIPARPSDANDPYRGLECRWEDVRSATGETLTLLVDAAGETPDDRLAVYRETLRTIESIYGPDAEPHPIDPDRLRLSRSPRRFSAEVKLRASSARRLRHAAKLWVLNLIGIALIRFGIRTSETDWAVYPSLLRAATDYRKFDDVLRMVLTTTPEQRQQLEAYLERRCADGALAYGTHVSDRAVLTCLVHERMGRQVHFVDGADGGYTLAAAALKHRTRLAHDLA